MRRGGTSTPFVAALALALHGGLAGAQEAHAGQHEHANELALFLGGTTEKGETHFTIGAEYERRLGERFGLSLVAEHVGDVDAWVLLAPITLRPWRGSGLKLFAGPGLESKSPAEPEVHGARGPQAAPERETLFVLRGGVGWAFELRRVVLTPQLELDLVREDGRWEDGFVFGIAIGFGF